MLSDPEKKKRNMMSTEQTGSNISSPAATAILTGHSIQTEAEDREYTYGGDFGDSFGSGGFSDFFENLFSGRAGFESSRTSKGKRSARRANLQGDDLNAEMSITLEDAYKGAEKCLI